ncbi:MAG: 30S ribosomal protein S20 [Thermodesulfovibrionia bacterium]|nr:30S ribosomal protein S20 [Thermodesulfovibrionia bacterium]
MLIKRTFVLSKQDCHSLFIISREKEGGEFLPAKAALKKNKSAIKRCRQTKKITLKNRSINTKLKTLSKKVRLEVTNKSAEGAKTVLSEAVTAIDKAAAKGIIHKNTASRKVSSLTRLVNSLLLSGAA